MNIILALYMASIPSSLITNIYLNRKSFIKAKKEENRKIKYKKGLNYRTKDILSQIKKEELKDYKSLTISSLLPIYNIYYTIFNIVEFEDNLIINKELLNEIYTDANNMEDWVRKMNVNFLLSIKDKLNVIPENIDDEDYKISDSETKKILKLNKLNYEVEMLKYEKENNIKY